MDTDRLKPRGAQSVTRTIVILIMLLFSLIPVDVVIIRGEAVGFFVERQVAFDWPIVVIEKPRNLFSAASLLGRLSIYRGCLLLIGKHDIKFMDF